MSSVFQTEQPKVILLSLQALEMEHPKVYRACGPEQMGRIASPFFFLSVQPKLMQLLSSRHDNDDVDSCSACGLL